MNKINTHVELEENSEKELLEIFEPLNKFFFQFRNNIQHVLNLIENLKSNDEVDQIVNLLCHFFYENILIQKPEQEEILLICYYLLEKEIDSLNSPSVSSFLNGSFIGKLLKSFTRRQDIKSYLSMVCGDLILKMEKSTINFLEIDVSRINEHIRSKKQIEILNKSFNLEKVKKMFETDKKKFLIDKIRKTTISKKNNTQSSNTIPTPDESKKNLAKTYNMKSFSSKTCSNKIDLNNLNNIDINLNENSPTKNNTHLTNNQQKELLMLHKVFANKKRSVMFSLSRDKDKDFLINNIEMAKSSRNSISSLNTLSKIISIDGEYEEDPEYNHDYLIDLTEEELKERFDKEKNIEMKEFCNLKNN